MYHGGESTSANAVTPLGARTHEHKHTNVVAPLLIDEHSSQMLQLRCHVGCTNYNIIDQVGYFEGA